MSDLDLTPGSPEWQRRVSPSKAAAILGISPWDSQYSTYRQMRGEIPPDDESAAMERGTLCEPAVLAWWRKHHEHADWREQVTLTIGDWCVATPDALATHDGEVVMVEAKTAANMDSWGDEGTDAIPDYYLAQVYTAMHVCHANGIPVARAHVPVLGGYRMLFANYVVEYDAAIGATLLDRLSDFHDKLSADTPPPLDSSVATYEAVRRVHPDIDSKAEADVGEHEGRELLEAVLSLEDSKARERLAKATVIEAMGRANYALSNGVRVARRQPNKSGVSFVALPKNLPLLTDMEMTA